MNRFRTGRIAAIVAASVLASIALPTLAGQTSSGGPWSYTRQGVVCQFSGQHYALNNNAEAKTLDNNAGCGRLMVRLKSNPGPVDSGWFTSPCCPASYAIFDPLEGSTAVSSEHRAQSNWDLTYSGIQRPHAW